MRFVTVFPRRFVVPAALIVAATSLTAGIALRHKPAETIPAEMIPARDIALLPNASAPIRFSDVPQQSSTKRVKQPRRVNRPAPLKVVAVSAPVETAEPVEKSVAAPASQTACERCPETTPDPVGAVAASSSTTGGPSAPAPDVYIPGSIGRAKSGGAVDQGPVTDGGFDSLDPGAGNSGRSRGGHGGGYGGGGGRCRGRGRG